MLPEEKPAVKKFSAMSIYYATETNSSFELALHLYNKFSTYVEQFRELTDSITLVPIGQRQMDTLDIFFVSTTGQGDPPYPMRPFWKSLMRKDQDQLRGLKFAVFGLGDRGYGDNYNLCARKLRQRLLMLGAEEVIEICLGDEQEKEGCWGIYEGEFLPKLEKCISGSKVKERQVNVFDLRMRSVPLTEEPRQESRFQIKSSKLMSDIQGRTVYFTTLKVFDTNNPIKIGDVLSIYPRNPPQTVSEMVKYFRENSLSIGFPEPSLINYLRCCANLHNTLNYTFFKDYTEENGAVNRLSHYVREDTDLGIKKMLAEKICQLGSDYEEYHHYIKKYKRNVREVIQDFNLLIPVETFIRRLSTVVPRKYSIASISEKGDEIGLLLKLELHHPTSNRVVQGLCSHDLIRANEVRMGKILTNGQFYIDFFTSELPRKIMMVSLGTGIAPFLSIMQQALNLQFTAEEVRLVLFHSSRHIGEVPMKQQLMDPLIESGVLSLYDTYTREDSAQCEKRRIQLIIEEKLEKYLDFFEDKVLICGTSQFCQVIDRVFEKASLNVKKLRKLKVICSENW